MTAHQVSAPGLTPGEVDTSYPVPGELVLGLQPPGWHRTATTRLPLQIPSGPISTGISTEKKASSSKLKGGPGNLRKMCTVWACMCVPAGTCLYTYVHVFRHMLAGECPPERDMYTRAYTHMCAYIHTVTGVHNHLIDRFLRMCTNTFLCTHMYTYAVHMTVCQYACECVCPHVCKQACGQQ